METQVTNLKLNVTNIKSYLISSNKELKKLKTQKKELFFKLEKKQEVSEEEKRIETKNLGIGAGFSRLVSTVTAPAKSIFDRILEFFGIIALGILVRELPGIIAKIEEFFNSDFIKGMGSVLNVIGLGFQKLGDLINILTPKKQKELNEEIKNIGSEIDDGFKLTDQSNEDLNEFEKRLREREKELQASQNQSTPSPSSQSTPLPTSQQPQPRPQVSPSGSPEPQKYSEGGTVTQPQNENKKGQPKYTPRKSGQLKQSERSMSNGFNDFGVAVDNLSEVSTISEKNMLALADFNTLFRDWSSLEMDGPHDPKNPGKRPPRNGQRPRQYSPTPSVGMLKFLLPYGNPIATPGEGFRQNRAGHNGIDIGVDPGSPVIASQDGVVENISSLFGTWGEGLYVKYKDGHTGVYGHIVIDSAFRTPGTVVKKGQKIGVVKDWPRGVGGNTSYEQNSHLHYERINPSGAYIDPYNYIQSLGNRQANSLPSKKHQGPVISSNNGTGGRTVLNSSNRSSGNETIIVMVQPVETFVPMPIPQIIQQPSRPTTQRRKLPTEWSA